MKACPFCRESIQDDAIKCRFCQSMLIPLQTAAAAAPAAETQPAADRVTYVLDNDVVRFAKFTFGALTIFVVIGAYLFGVDLKQASKEVKEDAEKAKVAQESVESVLAKTKKLQEDSQRSAALVQEALGSVKADADKAHGIVESTDSELATRVQKIVDASLEKQISAILTPQQLQSYEQAKLSTASLKYTRSQIGQLVNADLAKTSAFFAKYGFAKTKIPWTIYKTDDFQNTYWDGKQVVFGMGMVNSDLFGPYDAAIVAHEATHKLFNIPFENESGAVSESVCDVIAVLISGNDWFVGRVRGGNGNMHLRSLSHPGSAYDNAVLGKDPQPDHMSGFIKTTADNGGVHSNCGILNKVAYLMSEGGTHRGVTVASGIGRERLASLYMSTIRAMPGSAITFADFKNIVLQSAQRLSFSTNEMETVKQSFSAVGL